ncbi:RNA-directed DNA polymerase, eukaryota, reverse transcriptase zinc-binding domain protein, partial [Tanacetum coccineum]
DSGHWLNTDLEFYKVYTTNNDELKLVGFQTRLHLLPKYVYKAKVNQANNRGNVYRAGKGGYVIGQSTKPQGKLDKERWEKMMKESGNIGVNLENMNEDVFVDENAMGHKLARKETSDSYSEVLMNDNRGVRGCVNDIEVADLRNNGFHFTWTKSLLNPNSYILKKLDRIMGNDQMLAYKEEFLSVVSDNWKNKKIGFLIDKDPNNQSLKESRAAILVEYMEAIVAEEKLLYEVGNVFSEKDVAEQFLMHLQNFLSNTKQTRSLRECKVRFDKKVEECDSVYMIREVTNNETGKANFDIADNKAPEFFKNGKLLKEINATLISLVPKTKSPTKWIMKCVSTPSFSLCVNGERIGYFKGGRGLRQGDPMSPYLFTLIMEVLNLFLKQEIKDSGEFVYHLGCKDLMITHLCFANDLLILSNGDVKSVIIIKKALELFSDCSGLQPNMKKSTLFCGSVKSSVKMEILNIMPFSKG